MVANFAPAGVASPEAAELLPALLVAGSVWLETALLGVEEVSFGESAQDTMPSAAERASAATIMPFVIFFNLSYPFSVMICDIPLQYYI